MKLLFVPVSQLKPIQSEVSREKIDNFKANPDKLSLPIIVSKGGLILDGHHRFLAAQELDQNAKIPCLVAFCGIKELVRLGHEFDGSFTKTVHESTIYSRYLSEDNTEDEGNMELIVVKTLNPWTDKLRKLQQRRQDTED